MKAANSNHAGAQLETGRAYLYGRGVERSVSNAMEWLNKAAKKSPEAQFLIGVIYLGGFNGKADPSSALNWFKRASSFGHSMATNNAAWIYSTSHNKSLRNGSLAIKIMTPLVEKAPEQYIFLDTLAAAYAEAEQFEQAVEAQQKAVDYLPPQTNEKEKAGYIERLQSYQNHQPWREDTPAWPEDEEENASEEEQESLEQEPSEQEPSEQEPSSSSEQ
nr:tetratricopeptide repeat protein [Pleionea sp. CnH1-48]